MLSRKGAAPAISGNTGDQVSSQISLMNLMDVIREWGSTRGRAKSRRYLRNLTTVAISLLILGLFLATLAMQMDPARYVSSNTAIKRIFLEAEAKDIVVAESVWDWLDDVVAK
jgi:hypothetical protein